MVSDAYQCILEGYVWCAILSTALAVSHACAFLCVLQLLLTATPFRSDRQALPMADLMGDGHSMKVAERIRQGLVKNVALALVPVTSVTTQVGMYERQQVAAVSVRTGDHQALLLLLGCCGCCSC
jgi:hypothetical protein